MPTKRDILALVKKHKEELRGTLTELATPVDFADLVARGVLKKSGSWYILAKPKELPKHAWAQIKSIARITENGRHVEKVQFRDATKRANQLLQKIDRI